MQALPNNRGPAQGATTQGGHQKKTQPQAQFYHFLRTHLSLWAFTLRRGRKTKGHHGGKIMSFDPASMTRKK